MIKLTGNDSLIKIRRQPINVISCLLVFSEKNELRTKADKEGKGEW